MLALNVNIRPDEPNSLVRVPDRRFFDAKVNVLGTLWETVIRYVMAPKTPIFFGNVAFHNEKKSDQLGTFSSRSYIIKIFGVEGAGAVSGPVLRI